MVDNVLVIATVCSVFSGCIGLAIGCALNAGKVEDLEADLALAREVIDEHMDAAYSLRCRLSNARKELQALRPKPPVPVWDATAKKWRDANTGRWVKHG